MAQKQDNSVIKTIGLVSALGVDLVFTLLAGVFIGRFLDRYFDTSPLFFIIGMLVGLGAGIYGAYLLLKPYMGDKK